MTVLILKTKRHIEYKGLFSSPSNMQKSSRHIFENKSKKRKGRCTIKAKNPRRKRQYWHQIRQSIFKGTQREAVSLEKIMGKKIFLDTIIVVDIIDAKRAKHLQLRLRVRRYDDCGAYVSEDILQLHCFIYQKRSGKQFQKRHSTDWEIVSFGKIVPKRC